MVVSSWCGSCSRVPSTHCTIFLVLLLAHVNNVVILRKRKSAPQSQHSYKKKWLPPPLEKYASSGNDDRDAEAIVHLQDIPGESYTVAYISSDVTNQQLKELEV